MNRVGSEENERNNLLESSDDSLRGFYINASNSFVKRIACRVHLSLGLCLNQVSMKRKKGLIGSRGHESEVKTERRDRE